MQTTNSVDRNQKLKIVAIFSDHDVTMCVVSSKIVFNYLHDYRFSNLQPGSLVQVVGCTEHLSGFVCVFVCFCFLSKL